MTSHWTKTNRARVDKKKKKKKKKRKEEETNFSVSAMTPTVPPYAYRRSAFPRKLIAYVQSL